MPLQIPPPTEVLTLVFAAWAAGTAAGGALTRVGGQVDAGHFKVVWLTTAALAVAAGFGSAPMWILAALAVAAFAAIYKRADRTVGALAAAAGAGLLTLTGLDHGVRETVFALAGAALLGAVTNAMLLGHWHLNQPRLGTGPLRRLVWGLWGSLAAFAAASVALLVQGLGSSTNAAIVGAVTAAAFTAFAGVLTAMVTHLVRTRSIMSATGILYLEILLCFVAVFTGSLGALA